MTPEEEQVLIAQAAQGAQAWAMVQLMAAYNPDLIAGPGRMHFGNKLMRLDNVGVQIKTYSSEGSRGAIYFVDNVDGFMVEPPEDDDLTSGLWGAHFTNAEQNQLQLRVGNPPTGSGDQHAHLELSQIGKQSLVKYGFSRPDPGIEVGFDANCTTSGSIVAASMKIDEDSGQSAGVTLAGGTASAPIATVSASGTNSASIQLVGGTDTVPAYVEIATTGNYISISGAPLALPTNAGTFSTLTTDGMVQYDSTADKALLRADGVTETLATEDYVDTAIAAIPPPPSGGGYATHFLLCGA